MSDFAEKMPGYPQGEPAFVELLKSHVPFTPRWEARGCGPGELDATAGLRLEASFPDADGLLETAYCDFRRFLAEAGLAGGALPVSVSQVEGLPWEGHRLSVEAAGIRLEASDTEGVRRGLYHLRDLLAGSPYLKLGSTMRTPWLRNRISRCFFGPIKRPPFNVDELMNDIDYYPEEYLSRLAQEGVNGLWLTGTFRELCDTSIRPALPEAARRLAKLRATVERCRRYGIKTWLFCIEPIYWSQATGNPVPPGCEELLGPGWPVEEAGLDMHSFCVNSDTARRYLRECTYSLFSAVPHLGGLITISHGERTTSCLSRIQCHDDSGTIPCDRRCDKDISTILSEVLGAMKEGMTAANPSSELISWLYMPYVEQISNWITQLPAKLPEDVALAFNFESGITKRQLGLVRAGGDYWLSAIGPSDRFALMAQAVRGHCQFAAKLQVACSHECATVPYIPAPGLVYRKYRQMRALGVQHVMQCWYFGNYPGLMNEAAGKLAFEDFSQGEEAFLEALARPAWGRDWPYAVAAWRHFAEAYSDYPLDNQFQYYGPMHDGPVWPLYLRRVMLPLTRSWKPEEFPSGDAIGECMQHFRLAELAELAGRMQRQWHCGLQELQRAPQAGNELEFTLAEALYLQFRSGYNILRFYLLRNTLIARPQEAAGLLEELAGIVREEAGNSRRLAELCRQDARLGYHSEAEVYKYFPEKLEWRARQLQWLLEQDIAAARSLAGQPAALRQFLLGDAMPARPGKTYGANGIRWSFEADAEKLVFHLDFDSDNRNPECAYLFFMDELGQRLPLPPVSLLRRECAPTATGWRADYTLPRLRLDMAASFWFGVEKVEYQPDHRQLFTNDKPGRFIHEARLNLGYFGPDKLTLLEC